MGKENFNIDFSIDQSFNSDKFLKLRLKVCHDGLNKNNSYLSMDTIEKAKDSIQLIPILARTYKDENDEYQFGNHDIYMETNTFDDTKVKFIYEEVPIGFIPKECNYEILQNENNTRNYILVDGYIWKEYSNYAEEIIKRDEIINSSMEINVNSYEEVCSEDGQKYINITDFTYSGITLLGNNCEPAMYDVCAKLVTFALNKGMSVETMEQELNNSIVTPQENYNHTVDFLSSFLSNDEKIIQNMLSLRNDENHEYFVINTKANEKNEFYVYYWCLKSKLGYCQRYIYSEDGIITFLGEPISANFIDIKILNDFKSKIENLELEVKSLQEFKDKTLKEENACKKKKVVCHWNELLGNNEEFIKIKSNLDNYSVEELETQFKCLFADIQLQSLSIKKRNKETTDSLVNFSLNQSNEKEPISNTDLFIQKFKNY